MLLLSLKGQNSLVLAQETGLQISDLVHGEIVESHESTVEVQLIEIIEAVQSEIRGLESQELVLGRHGTRSRNALVAVQIVGEVVEPSHSQLRRLGIQVQWIAQALQVVYTL